MSPSSGGVAARRRAMQAVGATLAVYALAVVAHHGEFWPFSIYPMFARAGRPWTRALVIEVDPHSQRDWGPWTMNELPGSVYPTRSSRLGTHDLTSLVQLTTRWSAERISQVRKLFSPALSAGHTLMIVRGDGRLTDDVEVTLTGVLLIGPNGSEVNPSASAAP